MLLCCLQVRWPDSSQQRDHSAEREYLHETQMLWNREDEGGQLFPAGFHSFPFRFHLPPKIPSSFEGRVGWVRYELFSRIVTSTIKNDHTVEIDIPVMEIVDINRDQLLLVPTSTQTQKRVWSFLCTFSNVSMVVDLTRTGFCVGEDIPLNVSLENSSHHEVIIAATLRQKITYTAKRNKRQYDKATVVKVSSHPIAPRTSTIWPTNLRVPHDEATSQNYDPVHIAYSIKVVASVVWAQELVARIPITIGNIPYGESLVNFDTTTCREELQMCSHASTTSLLSGRSPHYTIHSAPAVSRSSTISVASSNLCSYESACTYSVQGCIDNKPANCHSVAWSNGPGERHSVALGNGSADLHSVARSNEAADTHSVARDESYI